MHKLYEKQLRKAILPDGSIDMERLSIAISDAYESNDRNRERTERSIALMIEELDERHNELKDREAELVRQNQHFKDAIDNMGHGLSMYDSDGCLVVCNAQFIRMYCLESLDPAPGMPFEVIRQYCNENNLIGDSIPPYEDIVGSGLFMSQELKMSNGRLISVTRHARDSGGLVMMHEDITEHRLLEFERERAENEARLLKEQEYKAETENKAKSEFLAMMSHEIRTPLNAVLGLTTTLLETNLDADQRVTVELIDSSGNNLLHLLNDILDFSKLDAKRMEFENLPFSPGSLIKNAVSIAKIPAAKKSLLLRSDISPELPNALVGDADRIRQVIYNLATNAVKFTQDGEVVIGAQPISRNKDGVTVEWWVRDTGIGIAPDQIHRLFKNFMQADSSVSRRFGGTGLGLAICRQIIEQMGGDISVTSREGIGSTFSFRLLLPLANTAEVDETHKSDEIDLQQILQQLGRPLRVLLAEDNPTNQVVFRKMLDEFSISIHVAANGLEAVESVQQFHPDIVYMDMRMPEMDGIEATRNIRQLGGIFGRLPIIALSANAFADDIKMCRDAGMNDFIAKPVRKGFLVSKIAQVVSGLISAHTHPDGENNDTSMAQGPTNELDLDREVFGELEAAIGKDGVAETLSVFLEDTIERLGLLQTLSTRLDRPRIKAEAHTLKGASSIFGFQRLSTLAANLEQQAATIGLLECQKITETLSEALNVLRTELNDFGVSIPTLHATRWSA